MIAQFKQKLNQQPMLKSFVHGLLFPKGEAEPRKYVRWAINPFFHQKGKRSKVKASVRQDLVPYNSFKMGNKSKVEDFSTLNSFLHVC